MPPGHEYNCKEHGMLMSACARVCCRSWLYQITNMCAPLQTMTSVIMLSMMLVGGFYVTDLPSWIGWMKVSAGLANL